MAKLVPVGPTFDRAAAKRTAVGLLAASKGMTLGGLKLKDRIAEGRE